MKYIKTLGFESYSVFTYELNKDSYTNHDLLIKSYAFAQKAYDELDCKKVFIKDIEESTYVLMFASGHSRIPAYNFYLKCKKISTVKFVLNPKYLSGYSIENSIMIFISNSGRTRKWINLIQNNNPKNSYLITNRSSSPLAKRFLTAYP